MLEIVGSRGDESPNLNIDLLMIQKLFSIVGEVPRACLEGAQPGPEPFERWSSWHLLNRAKTSCSVLLQQREQRRAELPEEAAPAGLCHPRAGWVASGTKSRVR